MLCCARQRRSDRETYHIAGLVCRQALAPDADVDDDEESIDIFGFETDDDDDEDEYPRHRRGSLDDLPSLDELPLQALEDVAEEFHDSFPELFWADDADELPELAGLRLQGVGADSAAPPAESRQGIASREP